MAQGSRMSPELPYVARVIVPRATVALLGFHDNSISSNNQNNKERRGKFSCFFLSLSLNTIYPLFWWLDEGSYAVIKTKWRRKKR